MRSKSETLEGAISQALKSQIELGDHEVVVDRRKRTKSVPAQASGESSEMLVTKIVSTRTLELTRLPEVQARQYDSLEQHREAICNCQLCPLGRTRNKFVYGVGNPNAKLMFIGEAPGADEDRLGEPFVGRAGQLLDKILEAMKFTRQDIYIANILKCRPPNNRDPQPDEMNKCTPYLNEQIRIIQPKLICLLGRIASQALLQTTTPLGKMRGQWHEHAGVPVIVTYHPAALLRFPGYKKETWEDMKTLRARYDAL
jgi:DNA polymerase